MTLYEQIAKFRKELISWAAFFALFMSAQKFYLLPEMEKIARKESNRVLYIYYSELVERYIAIPDKLPHQEASLNDMISKRELYKSFIKALSKKIILATDFCFCDQYSPKY